MRRFFAGVLATVLGVAGVALGVVYGGLFPVAADDPDARAVAGLLHTAYEQAVARAAADIEPPADLDDAGRIRRGAYNFQAMCGGCHTPPGAQRSVQAAGMNPAPPELAELLAERSPAEAFWVIDKGVRMTAMPAFGPSHEDDELWALVAFAQAARDMGPADYAQAVAEARAAHGGDDGHAHSHGPTAGGAGKTDDESGTGHHGDDHQDDGHHAAAAAMPMHAGNAGEILFAALSDGTQERVLGMLDPQLLVFESGGVEASAQEYAGHHLPHDMAFAAGMQATPLSQRVFEMGDYALVANHTRLHGEYQGEPMRRLSTETLLLKRHDEGWRIAHIHWSSRADTPDPDQAPPAQASGQ